MSVNPTDEEIDLLKKQHIIAAIRTVRERLGLPLREAKSLVDFWRVKMAEEGIISEPTERCTPCNGSGSVPMSAIRPVSSMSGEEVRQVLEDIVNAHQTMRPFIAADYTNLILAQARLKRLG